MKHLLSAVFLSLALAGCAYEPAITNRDAPGYNADLSGCRDSSAVSVDRSNAKTGFDWFTSPARRPFQYRAAVRACLAGKGYLLPS